MPFFNPWTRLVENISSKLAFFPPNPSTYEIKYHQDGAKEPYIQPKFPDFPKVLSAQVRVLPTNRRRGGGGGTEIVTAFVPYKLKNGESVKATLLYSHGNAVDLGQMLPFYKELSRSLKVNVMGYDYSGYGCSTGLPSVLNTLADIEAVYQCLCEQHHLEPKHVLLYGQSVGSGPTAHLASVTEGLAGIVMHTPLLSGVRVLNPNLKWWPTFADVYPNHLLVPKIKCPVLVMHGTDDEVIDISHGKRMQELSPTAKAPLWAVGFNHQNLELCPNYLPRLRTYLEEVDLVAPHDSQRSAVNARNSTHARSSSSASM